MATKKPTPEQLEQYKKDARQAQEEYTAFDESSRKQVSQAKKDLIELQRTTAINRRAMSATRKEAFMRLKDAGLTYRGIADVVGITEQAVYGFMNR